MSSGGYDFSTTTYSPDGRIFQTEYACKAVENSGTCIGIKVKGGVVLAAEKLIQSKLLMRNSNRKIGSVDYHAGIVCSGLLADGRHLINRARSDAQEYKGTFESMIPGKILSNRLALYVQAYTLYASVRPFGVMTILGVVDQTGPQLYMIEPSGTYWGYNACAAGKGTRNAKNELEKLDLSALDARQAAMEAARIIYDVHNASKDKEFELELSWICAESDWKHQQVPRDVFVAAETYAKNQLEEKMQEPCRVAEAIRAPMTLCADFRIKEA